MLRFTLIFLFLGCAACTDLPDFGSTDPDLVNRPIPAYLSPDALSDPFAPPAADDLDLNARITALKTRADALRGQ